MTLAQIKEQDKHCVVISGGNKMFMDLVLHISLGLGWHKLVSLTVSDCRMPLFFKSNCPFKNEKKSGTFSDEKSKS
jgi:2-hydroxy-3-keto-5-methylthiopentenyl-1-phosphate phosphatase